MFRNYRRILLCYWKKKTFFPKKDLNFCLHVSAQISEKIILGDEMTRYHPGSCIFFIWTYLSPTLLSVKTWTTGYVPYELKNKLLTSNKTIQISIKESAVSFIIELRHVSYLFHIKPVLPVISVFIIFRLFNCQISVNFVPRQFF